MRIWDLDTKKLCDKHLLGEHRELHAIWNILTLEKTGYASHPETKRWKGKLKALYRRHQEQVCEINRRGWNHNSSLDEKLATGDRIQKNFIDYPEEQIKILKQKRCSCFSARV